jgi:hypothetical protein
VANDGIQRGGNDKSTPEHVKQRYFCPNSDLESCQPAARNKIVLTSENQRPCRKGDSPTWGTGVAGGPLHVAWPTNGHDNEQSDGTCVTLAFAPYAADPDYSSFKTFQSCLPYHQGKAKTFADVTIPSNLKTGKYTMFWMWNFASFWYSSCVDFNIQGSGSSSSGGSQPATTTRTPTKASEETKTATTTPTPSQSSTKPVAAAGTAANSDAYIKNGCKALPTNYCKEHYGRVSYCMTFKSDTCGRSICHGGRYSQMNACKSKLLLL